MAGNFSKVFWGLLVVILDFSINNFDLLADGLGYLIIAWGCAGLIALSSKFQTARILCFVLAVLWLIESLFLRESYWARSFASTVIDCVLIWQILGGISDFSLSRQRTDLAERAHHRRLVYAVIMACSFLLGVSAESGFASGALGLVLAVGMLVSLAMILHLIHRTKSELATPAAW